MKQITIRKIPDNVHAALVERARLADRAVEAQVRFELGEAAKEPTS